MRELSSMAFEQLSLTKTQSAIQPELRRPLFPMGLLPTGYKPQVYRYLVTSCGGSI